MAINVRGFSWNSRNDVGVSPVICYYLSYSETARTATSATYRVSVVAGFIPEATSSTYYNYSTSWRISINGISSPSFASFSNTWTGDSGDYNASYGFQVKGSGSVSLTVPGVPSSAGNLSFSFISTGNGFGTSGDDCTLTNTVNLSSSNTAPNVPSINFPNETKETVNIVVTSTVSDGDSMRRTIQMAPTDYQGVAITSYIKEICNYDTDTHGWEPSGAANSYNITFSDYYSDSFRGLNFIFRAKSKEYSGGLESGWSEWFGTHTWNSRPISPTGIVINNTYNESAIVVSWSGASDKDNNTLYYNLEVNINDAATWNTLLDKKTNVSYSYDISNAAGGTKYKFRVKAWDGMVYASNYTTSDYCYKVQLPLSPTVLYPLPPIVYDTKPRIAILINKDPQDLNQKLYVTWKGVEYNNVDNPTLFSVNTFTLLETKVVIFKPSVAGAYGSSVIKVRTSNGYLYSDYLDHTINITDISPLTVATGDIIKADHILELRSAVSGVLMAYNQTALPIISLSSNKITLTEINEMKTKISSLTTFLNNLDSTNTKFDKTITWTTSDVIINNKYFEEIKNKLKDL